ncbi:VOC family protein [Streptomyces sp. WMMC500]|uniref:VOC family protein n=1 Tax=Streptomyces sp. WMMC500 TaxID=3015154 RepID=UPI00248A90C3|nr:VOC family protein [Streptomyces sp. WMMC500]WBB58670.1 VOC family protein [Streptomyces sp. WMMC500]
MDAFAEGSPCWADATLPDLRAGERFYGQLFGWTFTEGGAGTDTGPGFPRHSRALLDGRPVAALVAKQDGRMPTAWGVHLATPDLAGTVEKIRRAGGTVLTEPEAASGAGRKAVAADPDGAVFALWQGGTRRGFGATDVPGAFCWTEVYVRNADAADAFYPAVFGYELADPPFDAGDFKAWALPGSGREVAGRALVGDMLPAEMPPHFLVYFRVGDVGDALGTVRRGGGRVLVDRQEIPGATFAVVADNQGAAFAVMDGESGEADEPGDAGGAAAADTPATSADGT